MSQIGISFTPSGGSPVYNVVIDNFGGTEMPRVYQGSTTFSRSAIGGNILTGPAFGEKYMWVISSLVTTAQAVEIDNMFKAWDADRASGLSVACGIADTTFGAQVNTNAVFSTPPSYVRLSPTHTLVNFGLMEV